MNRSTALFLAGLLALTHYWAFYLLAATGLLLLWLWRRRAPLRRGRCANSRSEPPASATPAAAHSISDRAEDISKR